MIYLKKANTLLLGEWLNIRKKKWIINFLWLRAFRIHDIIVLKHYIFYYLFLLRIIVGRNNENSSSQKDKKIFFIKTWLIFLGGKSKGTLQVAKAHLFQE